MRAKRQILRDLHSSTHVMRSSSHVMGSSAHVMGSSTHVMRSSTHVMPAAGVRSPSKLCSCIHVSIPLREGEVPWLIVSIAHRVSLASPCARIR